MNKLWIGWLCFSIGCGSATTPTDGSANDVQSADSGDAIASDVANDNNPDDIVTVPDANDALPAEAGPPPYCPVTEMTGSCTNDGARCSYGTDPRAMCRDLATCMNGAWQVNTVDCSSVSCPSTPPSMGTVCSNQGDVCAYPDGSRYLCSNCAVGSAICGTNSIQWYPYPSPGAGCPTAMPNLGTACAPEAQFCDYGGCNGEWAMTCTNGVWIMSSVVCPR